MKLRLRNNSVRLRVTQSEVRRLAENGRIEEAIEFGIEPEHKFVYALEIAGQNQEIQASLNNRQITVFIPAKQAEEWINTTQVGLKNEQNIGSEKALRILVEKDFACSQTREGESDSDAFPNPLNEKNC